MDKQYQNIIKISVWSTIIFFVIRCGISWTSIKAGASLYELFGYAGEAIGLSALFVALFERWLWKKIPFFSVPILKKRYIGILKSSYDNVEREIELEIKQTFLSVKVLMKSNESKSNSISASIDEFLGVQQLTYCYLNTPKAEFRHRSEMHFGTAMLEITKEGILKGAYYTDRKTYGDMFLNPVDD